MSKALELAKFGRESAPAGAVIGDTDAQTLSAKTFSDMPTFSSGTANSLAYLNGSKVLTADGALGYDGTTFSTSVSVNSQAASIYTRNTNTGTSAWAGLTIGNDAGNNRTGVLLTSSNRTASGFVGPQSTYIYNSLGLMSIVTESNNPIYIGTNNTTRIAITSGGDVILGGGTTGYRGGRLVVRAANVTQTSTTANFQISTTDAQGIDVGGSMGLGGNIGTDETPFGYISGRKENATSGNYAGYLAFATQNSGAGVLERMRITSTGYVGIGTSSPAQLLDIRSANVTGASGATIRIGSQAHGLSGDEFANLEFYWGDPDAAEVKAKIYTKNVGNVGPGGGGAADLLFATTPAGGSLTQNLRITSTGQIIIGSGSTADRPFHLIGSGTRQYIKAETTTNSISNEAGFDIKTPNSNFIIGSHGSTNALWIYDINAAAERLRIDSVGNLLIAAPNNTGGGKLDLPSNATAVIQARSTATGTGDGTADVSVIRAVTAGATWWANARYDAFSHTWGYGGGATGSTAMRITGAGNLAIGTTGNTAQKLNVNGAIWLLGNDDANYSTLITARYDSSNSFTMQTRLNSGTMSEFLALYSDSGGGNPRLALAPNGWNVGIGTTTPWARFQVTRSVNNTNTAATNMSDYQGAAIILHNQDDAGTGNKAGLFFAFAGAPGLLSGIDGYKESGNWNTGLRFYTNNQTGGASTGTLYERMRIAPNGRVTIPYAGGSDSDPGFIVTCGSAANTFNWAASFLNPNLTAGKNISVFVGHTTNSGNAGYIGFNYQGSNAAANALTLGLHSNDNILNIRNDGAVIIGGLNPQAGTPKFGVIGATNQQYVTQLAWNYNNSEANWAGANALFIKNTYGVDGNTTQASIGFAVTNSGGDHHRASIHGYGVNGGSYGGLKFYTRGPNESIPRYTLNQNGVEINSNVTTWIGMYTRVYRYSFSGSAPGNMQTFSIGTLVNYDNTYCVATVKIRSPLVYATAGSNLGYWEGQATVRRANNGTAWVTVNSTVHAVDAANAVNDPIVYWSGDTCYMDVPTYVGVTAQIEVIVWAGEFTANNY